jgi:outer membrane protein assembly factor BamB
LWRFTADSAVRNTPVVCEGLVLFANVKGKIFGIDGEGQEAWSRQITAGTRPDGTPREAAFDAPLACFGGTLYAADADGAIFALDAATGEERWRANIGAAVMGTPNGSGDLGTLYVIAQDEGALHGLDAATGAERWKSEGPSRCDGSPGVGHGKVVYGSCDSALHVYSAATGTLERNIAIGDESQVASGVAIDGSAAFSGCRSGKVLQADLDTGAVVWSTQLTDAEIFTTPAVDAKWVVLGAEDGFFYALDRTSGAVRWKFETQGTPVSPVIAEDTVVAASDGTLYLLALADGAELWSDEVSDLITAPAVVDGRVIVGCDDGTVAAFDGRRR